MDEAWQSSDLSIKILVHPATRVTDIEDDVNRDQGRALIEYLSNRMQQTSAIQELPQTSMLVQQTPLNAEILVPATKSIPKKRVEHVDVSTTAISESILASGESEKSIPLGSLAEPLPPKSITQSLVSSTASTASLPPENTIRNLIHKKRTKNIVPQTPRQGGSGIQRDAKLSPVASASAEPIISPDSAKFVLQSPRRYRLRKRGLEVTAEQSGLVYMQTVLTEQSPNKRWKQSIHGYSTHLDEKPTAQSSDTSGTQLKPDGWLGSIAQLTSSSSAESMPKPLPSAETEPLESQTAYIAPWPASGHEPYTTHLVGTLALVAGSQRLCAAYRPKEVRRRIEALERGYWHLQIPYSWSTTDQNGFWEMLEEMIVQGKCGWGNWVEHIHEPLTKSHAAGEPDDPQHDYAQRCISEIKVWCWGEVVREVWLSLLMASRRQTLRLGMAWHDSCGNIVIQMR